VGRRGSQQRRSALPGVIGLLERVTQIYCTGWPSQIRPTTMLSQPSPLVCMPVCNQMDARAVDSSPKLHHASTLSAPERQALDGSLT